MNRGAPLSISEALLEMSEALSVILCASDPDALSKLPCTVVIEAAKDELLAVMSEALLEMSVALSVMLCAKLAEVLVKEPEISDAI